MNGLHAMIDIEALGTHHDCVIASYGTTAWRIGALKEGEVAPELPADLKVLVNVGNQPGRTVDGTTVIWWLRQTKEAQDATFGKGQPRLGLREALAALHNWGREVDHWWAWPAMYDLAILDQAYTSLGMSTPWARKNLNCARTLCKALGTQRPENPLKHDPLEDARAQAVAVMAALCEHHMLQRRRGK